MANAATAAEAPTGAHDHSSMRTNACTDNAAATAPSTRDRRSPAAATIATTSADNPTSDIQPDAETAAMPAQRTSAQRREREPATTTPGPQHQRPRHIDDAVPGGSQISQDSTNRRSHRNRNDNSDLPVGRPSAATCSSPL